MRIFKNYSIRLKSKSLITRTLEKTILIIIFNSDCMNVDYRYIIKISAVGVLSTFLVYKVKELIQAVGDLKELKKAEVRPVEDALPSLNKNSKSRLNLLKLKPYYFQTQPKEVKIRSAMRYKYEPSDKKIVEEIQKELSSSFNHFTDIQQIPVKWYAKIQRPLKPNDKNYILIEGLGKIKGDFFEVKKEYVPQTHLSYWSRFGNWIYQKLYKPTTLIQQSKISSWILGPVIGVLKYDISLMKDTKIIAVCDFQDGKIIPTVTATSKSQILSYYQNLISSKYIQVGALLVGTIFLARWIWSDIKKELNALKVRHSRASFKKCFENENLPEDKMCIICYSNVRNLIFFDCRHMIMCRECMENYDSDTCPYCKMEIDDIKPVVGIA